MNPPTVIALIIVASVVIGLIVMSVVNKKKGKTSCSCGCSGCAFKDSCHSNGTAKKPDDEPKGNGSEEKDVSSEKDNNRAYN